MKKKAGKVYLVGAGPGDPDLISVKGMNLLKQCDVVVYDALVNDILTASLPEKIKKIYVGKRGGKESTPQNSINRILVREALKGNMIVRLKGGDPLLLGRGSEEMEYLKEHNIPFEITPGISSALAAPAWAGIPVTHRNISRSVAIVTGHLKSGESIDNLKLPTADTLVFLMAIQNLQTLVDKLVSHENFTPNTPAAIVCNGTLPDQKVVLGTLKNIVKLKEQHNLKAPATVIIGKTASFTKTLNWYKSPPLAGKRVIVLRTPEQSDTLMRALYKEGASVIAWPIIKIRPRQKLLDKIDPSFLTPFTMVLFTSPNGVRIFMDSLIKHGIDSRHFHGKQIYALGSGTAKALLPYGIITDGIPEKFVAEGLLKLLPENLQNENILIPRAAIARDILPETLKKRGAKVKIFPVYDTIKGDLKKCPVMDGDYTIFTSSSIAEHFFCHPQCKDKMIIPCCMGDITAKTVRQYYKGKLHIAENATIPSLIDALKKAVTNGKK